MIATPHTAYSAHAWSVIALLRMLLAALGLVLAGSAAIPLVLAMHGAWGRILAALSLVHGVG